jgi:hypothetical protein
VSHIAAYSSSSRVQIGNEREFGADAAWLHRDVSSVAFCGAGIDQ